MTGSAKASHKTSLTSYCSEAKSHNQWLHEISITFRAPSNSSILIAWDHTELPTLSRAFSELSILKVNSAVVFQYTTKSIVLTCKLIPHKTLGSYRFVFLKLKNQGQHGDLTCIHQRTVESLRLENTTGII